MGKEVVGLASRVTLADLSGSRVGEDVFNS